MGNTTQPRERVKPVRTVRILTPPSAVLGIATIIIAAGQTEDAYQVTPIPSDFGMAYRVEKVSDPDLPTYEVCLEGNGGHCGCKGWCHRGTCRHVEALQALRKASKL
jgi:hypothetical protein